MFWSVRPVCIGLSLHFWKNLTKIFQCIHIILWMKHWIPLCSTLWKHTTKNKISNLKIYLKLSRMCSNVPSSVQLLTNSWDHYTLKMTPFLRWVERNEQLPGENRAKTRTTLLHYYPVPLFPYCAVFLLLIYRNRSKHAVKAKQESFSFFSTFSLYWIVETEEDRKWGREREVISNKGRQLLWLCSYAEMSHNLSATTALVHHHLF